MAIDKGKEVVAPMDKGKEDVPLTTEEMPEVMALTSDDVSEATPSSSKRRNYGHYAPEIAPNSFCKVILAGKLEALPMPLDFTKHFLAVTTEFGLKINTGCAWRVTVRLVDDRVTLDQGWATFAAVHQIKIGYMVTFKLGKHDDAYVVNV